MLIFRQQSEDWKEVDAKTLKAIRAHIRSNPPTPLMGNAAFWDTISNANNK